MAADLLERVRSELDARLAELRPAVAEYDRLLGATDRLGADRAATGPPAPSKPRKAKAAAKPRGAANAAPVPLRAGERAIVAALEHGSHTIGELGVVTAMSGADIRESARRLLAAGKVVRAKRDGRAAYTLSGKA